ncbi:MAG: TatD family hydrolase [Candidatus Omnitrophica bacterium]|nr:TatD family hydrolase [Candidatus Omnitrophota bacterium]MDD5429589.1 TatD family hydrolase [Candidatus Omnitrophota bacterium]
MLVDTHCHFNSLGPLEREEALAKYNQSYCFIDSSIDIKSSHLSLELSKKSDFIYSSLGFHPFYAGEFSSSVITQYEGFINKYEKIVAIGEVGFDSQSKIVLKEQEKVLIEFIKLANKYDLVLTIHNRLASFRILEVLDDFYNSYHNVVFHCFSYAPEFMEEIIKRNGMVSFSLNVLRNKPDIRLSLEKCPMSNLLLETDFPYMKIQGKCSGPADIKRVYEFCSAVKGLEARETEEAIISNVRRVFKRIDI